MPQDLNYPLRRQRQMCIRDQNTFNVELWGEGDSLDEVLEAYASRRTPRGVRLEAYAYTHLRAHETPEHLAFSTRLDK